MPFGYCKTLWRFFKRLYTAQGIILIQLNADSLYLFACWSICFLFLLILVLFILMLILIESRSMLIVYWLGIPKLINPYLTKNSIKNINLLHKNVFFLFLNWCCVKYTSMCLCIFVYINIILSNYVKKKEFSIQLCKLGDAMQCMLMRYIREC